jgi:hypothetical protein
VAAASGCELKRRGRPRLVTRRACDIVWPLEELAAGRVDLLARHDDDESRDGPQDSRALSANSSPLPPPR